MSQFLTRLERVFFYPDQGKEPVNYSKLCGWLEQSLKGTAKVELRRDFLNFYLERIPAKKKAREKRRLAEAFARIRVRDPFRREFPDQLLPGEIAYQEKNLASSPRKIGAIYDADQMMRLFLELIPKPEQGLNFLHLIFTEQMVARFVEGERYHLCIGYYGYPSIISTTGLREAPARPREYYLRTKAGEPKELVQAELGERILQKSDPRINQVIKGYILQAVFFQITGEPFCQEPLCQLYNAHWQEEMLRAQLNGKLCPNHQMILERYLKEAEI